MSQAWYVARTKTGREVTASVSVAEKGYPTFLPMQVVQRTHARKVEQLNRPLFPRYIFVRFDQKTDQYGDINTCRGVASRGLIVSVMDNPVAVPDLVIEAIRDRERIMRAQAGEIKTGYRPGDTFTVQCGTFASFPATYMGEERGKVMAIVELFGRGHIQAFDFADVPRSQNALDGFAA
jgi:transcriptional antiterminator RfaH